MYYLTQLSVYNIFGPLLVVYINCILMNKEPPNPGVCIVNIVCEFIIICMCNHYLLAKVHTFYIN